MLYEGRRNTVPSSKYGALLDLIERWGGTQQSWGESDDEMVKEALVRLHAEAKVKKAEQRRAEARAKRR